MATTLTISNETDAWTLLEKTIRDGMPTGPFDLVFDKWPILEFKLTGDKYDSSLTINVMKGFIDLQKNINQTYANLMYNKPNAQGLSAKEKEELEIVVKVESGSSNFQVNIQDAIETFLKGVANKMTGKEIVCAILVVSLIYGGVTVTKSYFENQIKQKQIESQSILSHEETERMKVFAEAMNQNKALIPAYERAEETYNKFLKGASEADSLQIGGQVIDRELTQALIRQTRSRSNETQLNGMYRIQKVDSSKPDAFFVGVKAVKDGCTFTAKLEDKWVFRRDEHLEELKAAEWGKKPVFLRINGKEIDGQVTQAMIVDVGEDEK